MVVKTLRESCWLELLALGEGEKKKLLEQIKFNSHILLLFSILYLDHLPLRALRIVFTSYPIVALSYHMVAITCSVYIVWLSYDSIGRVRY